MIHIYIITLGHSLGHTLCKMELIFSMLFAEGLPPLLKHQDMFIANNYCLKTENQPNGLFAGDKAHRVRDPLWL